jgi:hypothetical protein
VIGKRIFSKLDDGTWIEESGTPDRYTIKGDTVDIKESKKFRAVGDVKIRDVDSQLFEGTTTTEYRAGDGIRVSEYVERLWVNKDGSILRRETVSRHSVGESRTLWEYEYDPQITIEVPIK